MAVVALFWVLLHADVLTLSEALTAARAHQPLLVQSRARVDAAEARVTEARAPLLPALSASAIYQLGTANRIFRIGTAPELIALQPPPSWRLYDQLRLGLTASQLLFDSGRTTGRWRAARAEAQAEGWSERDIRTRVALDVRLAFFNARARKDLTRVARELVANQDQHLTLVRRLIGAKLRPDIDLAQAESERASAELELISSENNYAAAKADLNQAMGTTRSLDYDVGDEELSPVSGENLSLDSLVELAHRSRPDLASLDKQVDAQAALVMAALGGYGPAVHLTASATDVGPGPDPGPFTRDAVRWNVVGAARLTWPLFEGLATAARVREARALLQTLQAERDRLRLQVRTELERVRLDTLSGKSAVAAAARAVASATARLELAEGRYQAGVGNAVELGDAQLARATAAGRQAEAAAALSTARARLLHALGRE
jgi:outer membrane protein